MNSSSTCKNPTKVDQLPPWRVLLHNDNVNTAEKVINKVKEILKFEEEKASEIVFEADDQGVALLLVTHQERAEFFVDQFKSCKITVTTEKA